MILGSNKFVLIGTVLALFTGCGGVKVKQEVDMPALESGMVGAKKLAIFNIDGDRYGTFTGQVESYLANIKVHGNSYFEVLERQMLSKIIAEQQIVSGSGLFNEKDAVKLGNLSGADTLIMGGVRMPPVSEHHYSREEKTCTSYDAKKECASWSIKYRSCMEKKANVDFTLKAVSVQKGSIVFTKSYSGKAENLYCDGSGSGNKSETDLQNEAIAQILEGLRKDVAPYTAFVSIEFMEKDGVMSKSTKVRLKSAMELIEQKRLDRACEIFKETLASDANSPALYYNMGACAEIGSDFERAETFYKQADRKSSKPLPLISEAINRIKNMKSNKEAVSKQAH